MDSLVIVNAAGEKLRNTGTVVKQAELEGIPILLALIDVGIPNFIPNRDHRRHVLVEKIAFSANYRDKNWITHQNHGVNNEDGENDVVYEGFGSDFVAKVLEVGDDVQSLKQGDRVINCGFVFENRKLPEGLKYEGAAQGCPSNRVSMRHEIFHEENLIAIPDSISNEVGAIMSLGAVTAYSMIEKVAPKPGDNVLVTAAKSNTSLATITALANKQVNVYGLSTSNRFESELIKMGLKALLVMDPAKDELKELSALKEIKNHNSSFNGYFDCVVDPFSDIYFRQIIEVLYYGGRYTTCGIYNQAFHQYSGKAVEIQDKSLEKVLLKILFGNMKVQGNMMGEPHHLYEAVNDCAQGIYDLPIDSIYRGEDIDGFLNRTYSSNQRFGKVVYFYE